MGAFFVCIHTLQCIASFSLLYKWYFSLFACFISSDCDLWSSELISPFPADLSLSSHNALNSGSVLSAVDLHKTGQIGSDAKQGRNSLGKLSELKIAGYCSQWLSKKYSKHHCSLETVEYSINDQKLFAPWNLFSYNPTNWEDFAGQVSTEKIKYGFHCAKKFICKLQ